MGAPYGENNRGDLFHQKHVRPKQDEDDKKTSENLTAAAQVLALFSVLITTVTFASAFTLPGGNRSAGDGGGAAGTPVLAGPRRSYAFDAFILSDALAFGFSLLATSILLYVGVPAGTLEARFFLLNLAYGFMWHSGRSLVAAFGLGLYLVLSPVSRTIAIAVALTLLPPAYALTKKSEGINSLGYIPMIGIARGQKSSGKDKMLSGVVFVFDHFWSHIIIFGLPAIRKWARLP